MDTQEVGQVVKVLNPTVTVVVCSHMKPDHLPGALDSILLQTRQDIQIIVVDSGEWHDQRPSEMIDIYLAYSNLPTLEWYSLGEPPNLIKRKCPYAYAYNQVINLGLIRGEYVCFFTDDDHYYPTYIEKMVECLEVINTDDGVVGTPKRWAAFCAEDRVRIEPGLPDEPLPGLPADAPRHGASFLDQVDLLQMMIRTKLLRHLGSMDDPWFPEDVDPGQCRHADGLFMNKVGLIVDQIHNVPEALVQHRFTPESTYN